MSSSRSIASSANKAPEHPACEHKNKTKHGSNVRVKIVKRKDCGKTLWSTPGDEASWRQPDESRLFARRKGLAWQCRRNVAMEVQDMWTC